MTRKETTCAALSETPRLTGGLRQSQSKQSASNMMIAGYTKTNILYTFTLSLCFDEIVSVQLLIHFLNCIKPHRQSSSSITETQLTFKMSTTTIPSIYRTHKCVGSLIQTLKKFYFCKPCSYVASCVIHQDFIKSKAQTDTTLELKHKEELNFVFSV